MQTYGDCAGYLGGGKMETWEIIFVALMDYANKTVGADRSLALELAKAIPEGMTLQDILNINPKQE